MVSERESVRCGQQERGRGVVREICACRNISKKHGCVSKTQDRMIQ